MDSLLGQLGIAGGVIVAVVLVLRAAKPFSRNSKSVVQEDLKDVLGRLFDHQERHAERMTSRFQKQTDVLREISNTQKMMCDTLKRLEVKQ